MSPITLCSTTLPACSFEEVVAIAQAADYRGIELRVDGNYHQSLDDLKQHGNTIVRTLHAAGLSLPVLSSYIPLDDEQSLQALLTCSARLGVPQARVVLPRSCSAQVVRQAQTAAVIPAYPVQQSPQTVLSRVRGILKKLEQTATGLGVQVLLELHWGTIMSSFSSAYHLTHDLDPRAVALTFDPANMLVEGKEDWEFGLALIQPHLANVHVKNTRWEQTAHGWTWSWAPLRHGMVDWTYLLGLLNRMGYRGAFAIEDFLAPSLSAPAALQYLRTVREEFAQLQTAAQAQQSQLQPFAQTHGIQLQHS